MMEKKFAQITQLGFTVEHLEQSVALYHDVYGVGPWQIYELPDYRAAFCNMLNVQWKLLEPRAGVEPFDTFRKNHGPIYAHHVQVLRSQSFGETIGFLKGRHCPIVYENELPTGEKYCYFDTFSDLAMGVLITESNFDVRTLTVADDAIPGLKADYTYPADGSAPTALPMFRGISQLGIGVFSAQDKVRVYHDVYGLGPWEFSDCSAKYFRDRKCFGQPKDWDLDVANSRCMDLLIEICANVRGESWYVPCLQRFGEAINHIMPISDHPEEFQALLEAHRVPRGHEGVLKSIDGFNYIYDAFSELGIGVELQAELPVGFDPSKLPPLITMYPPDAPRAY